MTPLDRLVREIVAQEGPMSLDRLMSLALGHPAHGYYMTRDPFGAAGDFVTAPEISQMFGELLGLWAAEVWRMMGAPARVALIELGPGRGTLMADALRAGAALPGFREAVEIVMVETSPVLRDAQRRTLERMNVAARWLDRVEDAPDGPAIILANEFFDALPVRHYVRAPDGWRERQIGLEPDGRLVFGLAPEPEPHLVAEAPEGAILEAALAGRAVMSHLAGRVAREGGAALIVDYGYTRTAVGETLQALRRHAPCDPLEALGEADLTTHVDFAALARAARAAGAAVHGPITQAALLRDLGVGARAERLARRMDEAGVARLQADLTRLAGSGPDSMGELFKALAVTHPDLPAPPAFPSWSQT
jgi:SAM-dependent MidA family methyltransferase